MLGEPRPGKGWGKSAIGFVAGYDRIDDGEWGAGLGEDLFSGGGVVEILRKLYAWYLGRFVMHRDPGPLQFPYVRIVHACEQSKFTADSKPIRRFIRLQY